MANLITALFYLWLVITLLLIALWFLRRKELEEADVDELETEAATELSDGSEDEADRASEPLDEADGPPTEPAPTEPAEPSEPAEAASDDSATSDDRATSGADDTGKEPDDTDDTEKGGADTDNEGDSAAGVPGAAAGLPTIDDLLEGISLPYDLLPVTASVTDFDRHRIFLSTHPDAAEVGTAFADQLGKLGFAIEPDGFDEATARRGPDTLRLRMVPNATDVTDGGRRRYPAANGEDVALEVWIGPGSVPS